MNNTRAHRVIISGGGTGGHIYPAIAIANALKEVEPQVEILFVGAEGKMEMEKVPQAGYKIVGLPVAGLQRRLTLKNLSFPFKLLRSMWKARSIVKEFKPDIAIGVGGYASGPLLKVASAKSIPTLIQEQNSYAGLTNKLLARKARKICVAYPNMGRYFPEEKIVFTGNPVRKDILNQDGLRPKAASHFGLEADRPTILVIGGSLGARTINESVLAGLDLLIESGVQVIWQTGKGYVSTAQQAVAQTQSDRIKVFAFINEMSLAYALADVVISRAGALSISELCLVAKPCVLVPSPNVAEDHQTKNAMALVEADAAQLIKDEAAPRVLVPAALKLLENKEKQELYKQNIRKLARPEAAQDIAKQVFKILEMQN